MAITFELLEADPQEMRQGNSDALPAGLYTDEDLKALNAAKAKIELKRDLRSALKAGDDADIDSLIDDVTDKYQADLRTALMYRQLYWFYYENNTGPDTLNYFRMQECRRNYDDLKSKFHSFSVDGMSAAKMINIRRG